MEKKVTHIIKTSKGDFHGHIIYCPGCKQWHTFDFRWKFNGNFDKPTFKPSMLINKRISVKLKNPDGTYQHRCHSFVTDGKIEFLSDCTHDLVNQTIDLEPFE